MQLVSQEAPQGGKAAQEPPGFTPSLKIPGEDVWCVSQQHTLLGKPGQLIQRPGQQADRKGESLRAKQEKNKGAEERGKSTGSPGAQLMIKVSREVRSGPSPHPHSARGLSKG